MTFFCSIKLIPLKANLPPLHALMIPKVSNCVSLLKHMYYLLLSFSWLLQLLAQPTLGKNVTANIANATYNSFFVTKQSSCQAKCGNLSVPYPFGIGAACSFNSYFEISCSTSKPFLADLEVHSISPTQVRIRNVVISRCYDQAGATTNFVYAASTELPSNGPYTFSNTMNKLTVIGCDDSAQFWGYGQFGTLTTSCGSMCSSGTAEMIDEFDGNCTGIGCCQTDVPKGLKAYEVLLSSFLNHTEVWLYSKCGYAFMGEKDSFHFRSDLSNISDPNFVNQVPIVLDFGIGSQSCVEAQNSSAYLCLPNNSLCTDNTNSRFGGYLCSCENGYEGNPYLSPGCTDIDECKDPNLNDCDGNATCTNTPGSFNCSCNLHYSGDGRSDGRGCTPDPASQISVIKLSLGVPGNQKK